MLDQINFAWQNSTYRKKPVVNFKAISISGDMDNSSLNSGAKCKEVVVQIALIEFWQTVGIPKLVSEAPAN